MSEPEPFRTAMSTLLGELLDGIDKGPAYVLNPGDPGLLASLDRLDHAAASKPTPDGGPSIAAHVDHLRYGFSLLNRWSEGENPFASADYASSWRRTTVTAEEWERLRGELREETIRWRAAVMLPRALSDIELRGMLGSVVHLAYHLGAMRQADRSLAGPSAED